MRETGLTVNLSAGDSERERVCLRAGRRGRGGGSKRGPSGGRGRGRGRGRVARAGERLQSARETPKWRGTKRGSTGLEREADKDSGEGTGTDFPSVHSRPKRESPESLVFFVFFLPTQPLLKLETEIMQRGP